MPTEPRHFDDWKRHAIYLKTGYACVYSGYVDKTCTGKHLALDHIIPINGKPPDRGGPLQNKRDEPATNLVPAHDRTNSAKGDMTQAQWSAYAKEIAPPSAGLSFDWKDIEEQAKEPLDMKRGEQLSKLAKEARAARRLDSNGKRTIETPKSRAIAAKSQKIVAEYQAEQKAAAEKKAGPGVRHDKDGKFMPGDGAQLARAYNAGALRYALRAGEPMAISAEAIRRDADGFFVVTGGPPPGNEQRGTVAIVNVRGALQHWSSPFGDSYEAIEARVGAALSADPPPSSVLLRLDSPGGVVSGLNECVRRLQRMSSAAKIPLDAFVDEMAASAAYALCCACRHVLAPPSAVVGSVGVISTMVSLAEHDAREGIAFRIITSGKRKADGHLHMPISEDAVRAETQRNDELARQFFELAGKARRMKPAALASLQAAIYLGHEAAKVGLVDEVVSLDDALLGLDATEAGASPRPAPNEGNITDRRYDKAEAQRQQGLLLAAVAGASRRS